MNQEKTGAFIAKRRKELNLTQKEMADKLGITDRAVSKWENGRCMPDLSLLQPLSRILKVSVNDLLSGEIISEEEYRKKSESNLISIVDLNMLKSFRYAYFWFYMLAVLLLIYCLVKNIESSGVLALILAYSTAMHLQISDEKRCSVSNYHSRRDSWYGYKSYRVYCTDMVEVINLIAFFMRTW